MPKTPTLLWIDHQVARLFSGDGVLLATVRAVPEDEGEEKKKEQRRRPNKPMASGRRDEQASARFFAAVTAALRGAGPLALGGPGTAKTELAGYLRKKAPELDREVIGIQTLDHPTDRQLAAFARNYFAPPKTRK